MNPLVKAHRPKPYVRRFLLHRTHQRELPPEASTAGFAAVKLSTESSTHSNHPFDVKNFAFGHGPTLLCRRPHVSHGGFAGFDGHSSVLCLVPPQIVHPLAFASAMRLGTSSA